MNRIHLYLKDFRPNQPPATGMEKAVAGLAAGFVANGIPATILCESDTDHSLTNPDGVDIRCFRNSAKRQQLHIAQGLRDYAAENLTRQSLVILNAIFHPSVFLFARFLRKLGIPYSVAPHDPYHPTIFQKNAHMKWPYWYLIERPMLRRALAVQVLDKRHGELLKARGVRTPIVEVINGYSDVPTLESLPFREDGPPKLLYLGRFESLNKGLDLLLRAFDQVVENSDAVLTLQGPDSGDRAALEQQAAGMKHKDRITFLAPDYTATSSDLTARHDAFILPSRFEGFSLSTLEAMLAARPVIITDIAGLSPHVRAAGCGIVVDSTVESLVGGLKQLLARRPDWKAMGLAGREYSLSNLKWATIAQRAGEAYERLLNQN